MWRALLIAVIVLFGCKSRQKIGVNQYPNCKYAMYSKEEVVKKSDSSAIDFNWMKIKTKVDAVVNEQKENFTLQLRVKNDGLVFAKISKSGYTAVRILVSPDTLVYVEKINKQYYTGKYEDLQKLTNISIPFQFIQNLFLGEPTFLYNGEGFKKVTEPLIAYSSKSFDEEKSDLQFNQVQMFTCDSLQLKTVGAFDEKSGNELWVNYSDLGDINGYLLNKKIEVKALKDDKPLILAEMELKRIKTYDDLTAPIDIPNDYKRIEIK